MRPSVVAFMGCVLILLYTTAPTILNTDSPELVAAAYTRGIPHAPGYPLYTLIGNAFTQLPFDDPAYRLNLMSAFSLALTIPLLYETLHLLLDDVYLSLAAALIFAWSFYVWTSGIVAEVYALQALLLTVCGYAVARIHAGGRGLWPMAAGLGFGLAVAAVPSSVMFAPGLALAFLLMDMPWRARILAGVVSLLVFGLALVYFPLAYAAEPALNSAGVYNAAGEFVTVDLQSLDGIWWLLRGGQFETLFFADGLLPTGERLVDTGSWFLDNTLGFGVLLALLGLYELSRMRRGVLLVWLAWFLPYTYFFMTYGAPDRETMFVPSYLLLSLPIVYGLKWATDDFTSGTRFALMFALPLGLLIVNFARVNANGVTDLRDHTLTVEAAMPPDAFVFGAWEDVMPLTYRQVVAEARPDLHLYTLFFFENDGERIRSYVDTLLDDGETVIFFRDAAERFMPPSQYGWETIYEGADTPLNRTVATVQIRR